MRKLNELSNRTQNPVFVDPCPWHESTYLTAGNLFPPQLFVPASDKTPPTVMWLQIVVLISIVDDFSHYTAVRKVSMIPAF